MTGRRRDADDPVIHIGDRVVGLGHPVFVVAELSGNHNGSLQNALDLVDAAAGAGADAVKLQHYHATSMTLPIDRAPFVVGPGTPWEGKRLFDLYEEAATPWEWTETLFDRAAAHGIQAFSTPFDEEAIAFLEQFNPPAYKIASFELVDIGLVHAAAATGRPLILSTGMATADEINEAVGAARAAGATELAVLRCNSAYPAPSDEMDLRTIPHLMELVDAPVGLSDHTLGTVAATVAVALGACLVEKHITLSRGNGGPDASFSFEPEEFAALVRAVREASDCLGGIRYGPSPRERSSAALRRSLYVVADIQEGDVLTTDTVRAIRPSGGLAPRHLGNVIGRRALRAAPAGTPVAWDLVGPKAPGR